jgi:hypothetical protein
MSEECWINCRNATASRTAFQFAVELQGLIALRGVVFRAQFAPEPA